jgi:RNA polymerase sigma factor (sigma-70 family)
MVYGECRRLLADAHDAEDAAQAVFLVLWKKARSLRRRATLAAWLHRVAFHVCHNAQRARKVRKIHERNAAGLKQQSSSANSSGAVEVTDVLDEELERLAEKYRLPLLLFHFEGRSIEEIAGLMNLKSSTVGTRLSRGREVLRNRIVRRGIAMSATACAAALGAAASAAPLPPTFAATAAQSAALFGAGHLGASAVLSPQAAALAKGAIHMLTIAKFKAVIAGVVVALLAFGGTVSIVMVMAASEEPKDNNVIERLKSLGEDEANASTAQHLAALAMAMHGYMRAHNSELPPAAVSNDALPPEKRLSGLVLLLPYFATRPPYYKTEDNPIWLKRRLDPKEAASAAKLYGSIDLTKAWDDPANLEAAKTIVPVFLAPGNGPFRDKHGFAVSHFAFVRGYGGDDNGAFPEKGGVYAADPTGQKDIIRDGTSDTLAIGQVAETLGPWIAAGSSTSRFLHDPNSPDFGSRYGQAAFFANCDASVIFLDLKETDYAILKAFTTRAGGEVIQDSDRSERYKSVEQWKKATQRSAK